MVLRSPAARKVLSANQNLVDQTFRVVRTIVAEEIRHRFEMIGPDKIVEDPLIEAVNGILGDLQALCQAHSSLPPSSPHSP